MKQEKNYQSNAYLDTDGIKEYANITLPLIVSSASAGLGTPFNDGISTINIDIDKRLLQSMKKPHIISVTGDSMKPILEHNDKLLIEVTEKVKSGQIAVVSLNGEILIKEFSLSASGLKLISANPKYNTIHIQDEDDFVIIGYAKVFYRNI